MIDHIAADIAYGIFVETGHSTARIEGMSNAIRGLVEIDIGVVGEKAIRTPA